MEPDEYTITIRGPGLDIQTTPQGPADLELVYTIVAMIERKLAGCAPGGDPERWKLRLRELQTNGGLGDLMLFAGDKSVL